MEIETVSKFCAETGASLIIREYKGDSSMNINLLDKLEGQLIAALGGDVYSEGNGVFRAIFEESEWAMTAHTYAPKIAAFNQIPGVKVIVQIIKDEPRSDKHLIQLYHEIRMK